MLLFISLDAVFAADARRLAALPSFARLMERGVFCDNVQTIFPTLTYPIHTSMITGCYPDTHGIGHNQPFQPDVQPEMRRWYWDAREIKAKTLHQAAREKGMDVASILWPVSGMNRGVIRRNFPEVLPLPGENAAVKMCRYGSAAWVLWMEALYGKTRENTAQPALDDYAALLTEKLILSRRPPDFLTLHLVDCDSMRHLSGVEGKAALDSFDRLEKRLARVLAALDKRGLFEETIFALASDHGHEDIKEAFDLDAALIRDGVPARAQSLGRGAYIRCESPDQALQLIRNKTREYQIARILTDNDLRALRAPKDVHLAVLADEGVEYAEGGAPHRGDHGFSVDCPAARCVLLFSGGPFKRGEKIGQARVIDIAPTIARAAGLSLDGAQGRVLKEAFKTCPVK